MGAGKRIEVVLASSAVRNYLGPLFLILWSWPHTILSVVALMYRGGSYLELFRSLADGSVWKLMWSDLEVHGLSAAEMLMTFMVFQGTLLLVLPGTKYDGPRTVTGHVPQYKDTGLLAYAVSLGTLYVMTERLHFFKLSMVYDNLLSAMIIMNVFATVFCLCLYLKGRFYPSSTDNRFVGIFLSDYFRGIELYPRVGKFDVKMFTNCRFGMMSWPILCLVYAAKQKELYGSVSNSMWISVALQVIYCGKFFAWERGYMGTVDIIQDRGGYYICWGCLCLVPSLYTGHTLFLVNHPYNYPLPVAVSIFLAGIFFIFLNYWADLQRQTVRATDGKCTIWGKSPKLIRAKYIETRDEKQVEKNALLLVSGFWGISRHFHYVPEILAAVCWSAPAPHGFGLVLPYFYLIFLTILLFNRAYLDDEKCAAKYGKYWTQYRQLVPYRIIPSIY